MILPKAPEAYNAGDEQRTRHAITQEDKFNFKLNKLGDGVESLLGGPASGTGGPAGTNSPVFTAPNIGVATGASLTLSGALSAGNSNILPRYTVAGTASTNYPQASTATLSGYFLVVRWNANAGYALCFISDAGGTFVIASSNGAGGKSCFETANNFSSNGGQGIALFTNSGTVWIQTKSSYSGGAVRLYPFGG